MCKEVEDRYKEELKRIQGNMDKLEKQIREVVGIDNFNINSTAAIKDLLFVEIKCPVLERSKSGHPSISKRVVSRLAAMMCKDGKTQKFPVVSLILEYKKQYKTFYAMKPLFESPVQLFPVYTAERGRIRYLREKASKKANANRNSNQEKSVFNTFFEPKQCAPVIGEALYIPSINARLIELLKDIKEETNNESFNPQSVKDVTLYVYEELKCHDASNRKSLSKEHLTDIAEMKDSKDEYLYPTVCKIVEYKTLYAEQQYLIGKSNANISEDKE